MMRQGSLFKTEFSDLASGKCWRPKCIERCVVLHGPRWKAEEVAQAAKVAEGLYLLPTLRLQNSFKIKLVSKHCDVCDWLLV
jgi:hypothetical protein